MIQHDIMHYVKEPIGLLKSFDLNTLEEFSLKPKGFWISIEDGCSWKDWCEGEHFQLECFAYAYKVSLSKNANLLHLKTAQEVIDFGKKYRLKNAILERFSKTHNSYMDWQRVGNEYQGLIIAPYQWDCRLRTDSFWYYGWDCSSGCIWDVDAIAKIELVEAP